MTEATAQPQALSVFDMLKIGVGPSSSHTLGPWRAVQRWLSELEAEGGLAQVQRVQIDLYGSLALTGRGHCTDQAAVLALMGYDPVTIPVDLIPTLITTLQADKYLALGGATPVVPFDMATDIVYHMQERLPFHANGMSCTAWIASEPQTSTYYSIGGGFVVAEGEKVSDAFSVRLPHAAQAPAELRKHCQQHGFCIAEMVWANEQAWRTPKQIRADLHAIWEVMKAGLYKGCHTEGILPGGLNVKRRAAQLNRKLLGDAADTYTDADGWIAAIRRGDFGFKTVLKWVTCFALAVNEENAKLGRVVTAPTNGAAGVIPAVLMYHVCFDDVPVTEDEIHRFLMVAGEVGTFFKKRATISAAMGGCQAEIGVSSAMAAAALAETLGGTVDQALMAAEIAMEHHLGLTCDPIGGLVQVPCIERNSMGAIKAINAAELAIHSDPAAAKVSLDDVIDTMWETAKDMSDKYKETSQGGLAISVRLPEC
ncbi:MAG: L-serine ammonia-lyase [Rhodothermales bacterium]